jgi:hypothetical protein
MEIGAVCIYIPVAPPGNKKNKRQTTCRISAQGEYPYRLIRFNFEIAQYSGPLYGLLPSVDKGQVVYSGRTPSILALIRK